MRKDQLTRRAFVGGSVALAATACEPAGTATTRTRADPDVAAVRRAVADEEDLLARYDTAVRHHPQLASRLDAFATEHRAHLQALRARVSPSPSPLATHATPEPSSSHSPAGMDTEDILSALANREHAAADTRLDDLTGAAPFLAQLLASIGAAEATHAALLTGSS